MQKALVIYSDKVDGNIIAPKPFPKIAMQKDVSEASNGPEDHLEV